MAPFAANHHLTMDVDMADAQPSQHGKQVGVPVDDAHPFDLESYISNYTGAS